MPTIQISGHPLPNPMTFTDVVTDTYVDPTHWLLTQAQTEELLTAWREADTAADCDTGCCDDDLARAYHYSSAGVFVTALHMDNELTMDEWESACGDDGLDLYSTAQIPFDVEVQLI